MKIALLVAGYVLLINALLGLGIVLAMSLIK